MRWKWIGLAGVVGAAAIGSAVVVTQRRQERTWEDVDGDELRARLHERLRTANGHTSEQTSDTQPS